MTDLPTPTETTPSGEPSALERFLCIFAEVRAGEGRIVLIMFANVLVLLCAYYFIKPLREGWLAISGIEGLTKMELKAYSSFAQAALLIFVVSAYSKLVGRWPRHVLIGRATAFCMSNMVIFWLLQPGFILDRVPYSGVVFYLWVGIFGVFVIAQFWAFAADLFTDDRGRRLMPIIAIGATSGAVVGSWIAGTLVSSGILPTEYLLIVGLIPLALSIALTANASRDQAAQAEKAEPATTEAGTVQGESAEPAGGEVPAATPESDNPHEVAGRQGRGPLSLIMSSKLLIGIAVVTLLTNWVNTNGENLLFRVVQEFLEEQITAQGIVDPTAVTAFVRDGTTAFYGDFFFWVNTVALLLQALVASRLLKYGGFAAIFLALPTIALLSYSVIALVPVLMIIKIMKVAENATDYSINNTARHVFWLPFPSDITYKGKPAIDSMVVRIGDGLAALTVLIGVQVLALSLDAYFVFNVILAVLWLATAVWVVFEHGRYRKARAPAEPNDTAIAGSAT